LRLGDFANFDSRVRFGNQGNSWHAAHGKRKKMKREVGACSLRTP